MFHVLPQNSILFRLIIILFIFTTACMPDETVIMDDDQYQAYKNHKKAERNLKKNNKAEMRNMDKEDKNLYGPVTIIDPKK